MISRGLFSLQQKPDTSKSYSSMMMNLERTKERGRKRRRAVRSKNLTNETHFQPLSVSSEPFIQPPDVAGDLAASLFKMSEHCV